MAFYSRHALDDAVGFSPLDSDGAPDTEAPRELWLTCRTIHSFALEHARGRAGAAGVAIHGIRTLATWFRDPVYGGWFGAVAPDGAPTDVTKSAYGHAFVLLAGASARQAGLPGGAELLTEALAVIDRCLWQADECAAVDHLSQDWRVLEPGYRGQNANMHLAEAYMAATEATGDDAYAQRALQIANRILNVDGRAMGWRVPEHFDANWTVVPEFNRDRPADPFRPFGSLVGHWFEWARLVLQLDHLLPGKLPWAEEAARALFAAGVQDGWDDVRGGVVYSVDFDGEPVNTDRMHWVQAEGVGAAVALARATGAAEFEHWYRRFWEYISAHHIDLVGGSWWHELDQDGRPKSDTWSGKPDLYHALQATIYARSRSRAGLITAALDAREGS